MDFFPWCSVSELPSLKKRGKISAVSHWYLRIGRATDIPTTAQRLLYRALELQPGLFAWATLIAIVAASFWIPAWAAVFIICFDIYWFIKTIYLSIHINHSFRKMRQNMAIDWHKKLRGLSSAHPQLKGLTSDDILHVVLLPTAGEPYEVVRQGLEGLAKTSLPLNRLIVVLATEGRLGQQAQAIRQQAEKEFGSTFLHLLATTHPDGIEGELRGKGSNETWAGREVLRYIQASGIETRRVLVTVFDIDTIAHPEFFSCLTYTYLTSEHPLHSSFQPIPIFSNNIWHAPAFARVFAFSTTFWQMIQQARPEQLVTFSSQSISLQALIDVDFWQTNVVSEDSQIFWKCFLRYDGNWRTVPLHMPVYMDANVAETVWKTAINQYKQIRRWHYGVENNPYFLFGFIQNSRIALKQRLRHAFQMIEKTHSSATNAIIMFLLGWLPVAIGGGQFGQTVLSYNLPRITQGIMLLSMGGLISSAVISLLLLPPRPLHLGKNRLIWMTLQWLLFPINFIVFGAIPALDAQTRLMFGKYMGFWVTPKPRVEGPITTQSN